MKMMPAALACFLLVFIAIPPLPTIQAHEAGDHIATVILACGIGLFFGWTIRPKDKDE